MSLLFAIAFSAILEQIDHQTKMIFLCSPNNPTANSFDTESIKTLLESFRGLVIVDEAYIDFAAGESWSTKLQEYPTLVILPERSYSS